MAASKGKSSAKSPAMMLACVLLYLSASSLDNISFAFAFSSTRFHPMQHVFQVPNSRQAVNRPNRKFMANSDSSSNRTASSSFPLLGPSQSNFQANPFGNDRDSMKMNTNIARIPTSAADFEALNNENRGTYDAAATAIRRSINTDNRYFTIVEKLTPNEILTKFSQTAPRNVQEAAKSTIMNILGTIPQYSLDAVLLTTGSKLANLMFQMQITGYMLKNAEYRLSLTQSLKGYPKLPPSATVSDGNVTVPIPVGGQANGDGKGGLSSQMIALPSTGTSNEGTSSDEILLKGADGTIVKTSAAEVTSALSKEVEDLRAELMLIRKEREGELRNNMLTYIQALPEKELSKLTSDMSQEVMDSIQLLVDALMERLGVNTSGPEVVIQQSMNALAQLCMWQMVVGYKLRELEALEKGISLD